MKILKDFKRNDIISLLHGTSNIGIELGVAEGIFAERIFSSGKFKHLFGVDMYVDHHNTEEYKAVLKKIGLLSNYKLLRMSFTEAYDLFEDNFFDFVYVDGYAGNGEEGGTTIFTWLRKVKLGGVLAGDDYDLKNWPLVVQAVNELCNYGNYELMITDIVEKRSYCKYPSWAIIKTHEYDGSPSAELILKGKEFNYAEWERNRKS
jgi:hypothetical protein